MPSFIGDSGLDLSMTARTQRNVQRRGQLWWCMGILTWRWRRRLSLDRPRVSFG
ncbi:hypothetical protein ES332_A10G135000v1 [Gossypium tomentosum]|uniref:Uncharacterized protein n=1 Tax=Gossypium tomentosum TaxID=34277 RepID=A0A5D2NPL1_GOSTO|nr:hypothetical protein ES332_A10G135000v1 [Gossypium tomentosum]